MFFNRRPAPPEFQSEMADYDQDQDEYYGEEDDAEVGDDEDYDDEEDEDGEEDAPPAKAGGRDWVRNGLIGLASLIAIGGGTYYAASMFFPEVVDELVNSVTGATPEAPPAEAPVDTAAAPPGG